MIDYPVVAITRHTMAEDNNQQWLCTGCGVKLIGRAGQPGGWGHVETRIALPNGGSWYMQRSYCAACLPMADTQDMAITATKPFEIAVNVRDDDDH